MPARIRQLPCSRGLQRILELSIFGQRFGPYTIKLLRDLSKFRVFVVGGVVRDAILIHEYGKDCHVKDIDILVDDKEGTGDFRRYLEHYSGMGRSRLGSPSWRPTEAERIDIVPMSNANRLRNEEGLEVSLETFLSSCPIATSSIAYSLDDGCMFDHSAVCNLEENRTDILYKWGDSPEILLGKIFLQSERLGLSLGPRVIDFVVNETNERVIEDAARYIQARSAQMAVRFRARIEEMLE